MLKFVRYWFRRLISFFLWLILIGFALGGFFLIDFFGPYSIGGALIGGLIGLLIVTIVGGYMATFLNIDDNLEKIVGLLDKSSCKNSNNNDDI